MAIKAQPTFTIQRRRTLRIGFVPLNDCAPIVMAREKGFFAERGLNVLLRRELGWATVRDKLIYRELDATHALAAMPLAATLGLGSMRTDCLTAIVLNLNGNAITLSENLWARGVRDGASLREEIMRLRHERLLTFGVVNRFSSHHHLLRKWFQLNNISESQVRIVVLPPAQMDAHLAHGNLDGFCVGEPWNSAAVRAGTGWVSATSVEIDQNHPEKVLMVRGDFAERNKSEHLALIAALHEACAFCDQPGNAPEIAQILSRPEYVGAEAEAIRPGLNGHFNFGHEKSELRDRLCVFHREGANEPTLGRAAWTMELIRRSGACEEPSALNRHFARRVFQAETYHEAIASQIQPAVEKSYEEQDQLHVV